jgi:hypothetical protein
MASVKMVCRSGIELGRKLIDGLKLDERSDVRFGSKADSARHTTYPTSIVRLEPVMKPALALAR